MKKNTDVAATFSLEIFKEFISPQVRTDKNEDKILYDLYKWINTQYSESSRYYHNVEHIGHCISAFLEFKNDVDRFVFGNSQSIFTAICLHDIVYVVGRDNNEEMSAFVAEGVLTALNRKEGFIRSVKNLILITKHDKAPSTDEEKLITDIDLLGLSAPWEEFTETTEKIYKEFSGLYTREVFMLGRKKFFKDLLVSRDQLYHTPFFYDKCEKAAQENLQRFLET